MTTVTLDTLSNTASKFLRDVLRNSLSDPFSGTRTTYQGNWIFKGQPEDRIVEFPFVVINSESRKTSNLTLNRTKKRNNELIIGIEVWADKMSNRDTVSDQILSVLSTPTSADSSGDTIKSKHLFFKEASDSDEDSFKTETQLIRLKTMSVTFVYGGN